MTSNKFTTKDSCKSSASKKGYKRSTYSRKFTSKQPAKEKDAEEIRNLFKLSAKVANETGISYGKQVVLAAQNNMNLKQFLEMNYVNH